MEAAGVVFSVRVAENSDNDLGTIFTHVLEKHPNRLTRDYAWIL